MANTIKLKQGSGSDPSASDLALGEPAIRTDTGEIFLKKDDGSIAKVAGGIDDGDKGDIVVSNDGATFTVDAGVITNAKVSGSAAIAGTKISPNFGSQNIVTSSNLNVNGGQISISGSTAAINFTDNEDNPDYRLVNSSGIFKIRDNTNGVDRLKVNTDGHIDIDGNLDVGAGIDVTGNVACDGIRMGDSDEIRLGNSDDLKIFHSGSHSRILDNGTGKLQFGSDTGVEILTGNFATQIALFDSSQILLKENTSVTGNITATGNLTITNGEPTINLTDSDANPDFQIKANTGIMYFVDATNSQTRLYIASDGTVNVNGNLDVGAGIDVTGNVACDGIRMGDSDEIRLGNSDDLKIFHDGSNSYLREVGTGNLFIESPNNIYIGKSTGGAENCIVAKPDGAVELYYDNVKKFNTSANGGTFSGNLFFGDGGSGASDNKITLGNGSDLQLYHDSTNSIIANSTGRLEIRGSEVRLVSSDGGENILKGFENGAVELYYDSTLRFKTHTSGNTFYGSLYGLDGSKIELGHSNDLKLYHDGTHSYLDNATGSLFIRGDAIKLRNAAGTEAYIECVANGAVNISHNDTIRLATTSAGSVTTGVHSISNGILEVKAAIATSHTLTADYNALAVDPTINNGVTVTVPSGAVWAIV